MFFFFVDVHSPCPGTFCPGAAMECFLMAGSVGWPSLRQQGVSWAKEDIPSVGRNSRTALQWWCTSRGWAGFALVLLGHGALLKHFSWHLEIPPTRLIFPSLGDFEGERVWVPFLLHSSLSGVPVWSWFPFSLSSFLLFTQSCHRILAIFGGLCSSASIQLLFWASHLTCRYVFLLCLWEMASTCPHSSAILPLFSF